MVRCLVARSACRGRDIRCLEQAGDNALKTAGILFGEAGRQRAVEVEYSEQPAVMDDWDDDFGA